MNAQEAEAEIVKLVQQIDRLRAANAPQASIAVVDAKIAALKTGPRHIVGVMNN